ncbi:NepR family anti-sigma factor [Rhizobium sp. SG2393]|uniref:NepR family anti-sigma factor n=1 Tax=Rhizobium sp. SG2393 TaxID=3276279 RepID=UPI003671FC44
MTDSNGRPRAGSIPAGKTGADTIFPPGDANRDIALRLKALYDDVENQPIPDMFLDLLEKLDAAEAAGRKS